ncbi:unnamed protein product, partial [Meganyctiphanes norvegica]
MFQTLLRSARESGRSSASTSNLTEQSASSHSNSIALTDGQGSLTAPTRPSLLVSCESDQYVVYKVRWVMLCIFVVFSMSNAFQWIQYSIITHIISDYYDVPSTTVDWLSMLFMITYIPLIFPATWFLQVYGLRKSIMIGSFGNMVGAAIKCFCVKPNRFWVTFTGQLIAASSQVFVLGIPAPLAAVWFGPDQVSTACALGVFGNQLGIAIGFLVPPAIVHTSTVESGLRTMFYSVAAICATIFVCIVLIFKEKPKTPPSASVAMENETEQGSYIQSIIRLLKNKHYLLLLISYGMNAAAFYAISTLLSQIFLIHFPGEEENAGRIGLVLVLSGMCGSIVCGVILDKTGKFKMVTLSVYIMSLVFMIAYTFIFQLNKMWLVYVVSSLLGAFMTGYLPVGFEFAAELTYPESEGTSSGLLNASAQVFGILCTIAAGHLLKDYGDQPANLLLVAVLLVGTILTAFIREDLRRQEARSEHPH